MIRIPEDFPLFYDGVGILAYRGKPITETVKIWMESTDELVAHFRLRVGLESTGPDTIAASVHMIDLLKR